MASIKTLLQKRHIQDNSRSVVDKPCIRHFPRNLYFTFRSFLNCTHSIISKYLPIWACLRNGSQRFEELLLCINLFYPQGLIIKAYTKYWMGFSVFLSYYIVATTNDEVQISPYTICISGLEGWNAPKISSSISMVLQKGKI